MTTELTEEEIQTLKEVARNIQAGGRISRVLKTVLLWAAGVVTSWVLLWEFIIKNTSKSLGS